MVRVTGQDVTVDIFRLIWFAIALQLSSAGDLLRECHHRSALAGSGLVRLHHDPGAINFLLHAGPISPQLLGLPVRLDRFRRVTRNQLKVAVSIMTQGQIRVKLQRLLDVGYGFFRPLQRNQGTASQAQQMWVTGVLLQTLQSYARSLLQVSRT